jgi:hypothetical protein
MTSSGIEPAIFPLGTYFLNELRYRVPLCTSSYCINTKNHIFHYSVGEYIFLLFDSYLSGISGTVKELITL